jgi:hypothetical protein
VDNPPAGVECFGWNNGGGVIFSIDMNFIPSVKTDGNYCSFPAGVGKLPIGVGKLHIDVRKFPFGVEKLPFDVRKFPFGVEKLPFDVRKFPFGMGKIPDSISVSELLHPLPRKAFGKACRCN